MSCSILMGSPQAIDALVAAGKHAATCPRCGADSMRRFAKDVLVLVDGMTVDLHRTLIRGPFGERLPVAEVLGRGPTVALGERAMRVLDPADAYVSPG